MAEIRGEASTSRGEISHLSVAAQSAQKKLLQRSPARDTSRIQEEDGDECKVLR